MINKTEKEIVRFWKKSSAKPMVSICTITYNHEMYIADALDSFLMQKTDFSFEIIVYDDCSVDNTAKLVKDYMEKYPNIIKANLRRTNVGVITNFRESIELAKGDYVALCEGDDYWTDPLKLQAQYEFLIKNPEYSACYSAATVMQDGGKIITLNKHFGDSTQDEMISGLGHAITGSVMFESLDLSDMLEYDIVNGDSFLWHLLGMHGACKYLESIGNSIYRVHDGGIWSGRSIKSKLSNSFKSYTSIRCNIIRNFGENSSLLNLHDTIYIRILIKYFIGCAKKLNISNCYYGIKKLIGYSYLIRFVSFKIFIKRQFNK